MGDVFYNATPFLSRGAERVGVLQLLLVEEKTGQTLEQPARAQRWLQEIWRGMFYMQCQDKGEWL